MFKRLRISANQPPMTRAKLQSIEQEMMTTLVEANIDRLNAMATLKEAEGKIVAAVNMVRAMREQYKNAQRRF